MSSLSVGFNHIKEAQEDLFWAFEHGTAEAQDGIKAIFAEWWTEVTHHTINPTQLEAIVVGALADPSSAIGVFDVFFGDPFKKSRQMLAAWKAQFRPATPSTPAVPIAPSGTPSPHAP